MHSDRISHLLCPILPIAYLLIASSQLFYDIFLDSVAWSGGLCLMYSYMQTTSYEAAYQIH